MADYKRFQASPLAARVLAIAARKPCDARRLGQHGCRHGLAWEVIQRCARSILLGWVGNAKCNYVYFDFIELIP